VTRGFGEYLGTPSSHREGQTGTRKFKGRTRDRGGQEAEVFAGNMTRQRGQGQAGAATGNRSEKHRNVSRVKAKIQSGGERVGRRSLNRES